MAVVLNNTNDNVILKATTGTNGIYHQWNGTILTITSDSGTSACDLKGEKGDDGPRGPQGLPGDANLIEAVEKAETAAQEAETALSQLGTARDEAVVAAAQVKQIVAGNEAYTKGESDIRYANAIKPTVKDNVVSITDAAAAPTATAISHIEPTQAGSGDASPTNIRPIGGWDAASITRTGKNLLSPFYQAEGHTTVQKTQYIAVKPGTIYTLSIPNNTIYANGVNVYIVSENTGIMHQGTWDNTSNYVHTFHTGTNTKIYVQINNDITITTETTLPLLNSTAMLEEGATATAYEPYQGQTLSATLPQTIYGGTLDWNTGVLTKCERIVYDGVTAGKKLTNTDNTMDFQYPYAYANESEIATQNNGSIAANRLPLLQIADINAQKEGVITTEVICVKMSRERIGWVEGDNRDAIIGKINIVLNQWYNEGHPLEVVYYPTNPETIQLTPQQLETLKGVNNVWSDCGNTTLTYIADTQLYIDNKINELSTALVAMGG